MVKLLISGILGILMFAMPVLGQMTSQDVINQITNAERKLTEAQFKEFIRNFENQKHKVHWRGKVTDVKEVMILGNFTDQRTVWVADFVFFNMDKSIALTLNKGQEIDFTGTISSFLRIPFLVSLSIGLSDVQLHEVLQDKPIAKESNQKSQSEQEGAGEGEVEMDQLESQRDAYRQFIKDCLKSQNKDRLRLMVEWASKKKCSDLTVIYVSDLILTTIGESDLNGDSDWQKSVSDVVLKIKKLKSDRERHYDLHHTHRE